MYKFERQQLLLEAKRLNEQEGNALRKLMEGGPPTPPADSSSGSADNSSNNTTDAISRKPIRNGKANPRSKKLQRIKATTHLHNANNILDQLHLHKDIKNTKHNLALHNTVHAKKHSKNHFHQITPKKNSPYLHGGNIAA